LDHLHEVKNIFKHANGKSVLQLLKLYSYNNCLSRSL